MYNHKEIEAKWQKKWEGANQSEDFSKKEKKYVLIEFPYPSGAGLHVGHVRSYTALDVYCRKLRMEGKNVLYPIGWDAFGLPTENYAIKNKIHPRVATEQNVKVFTEQIKSLGISFDWSREINTTDPKYYKWTQWIFLKLLEKGLAYKANIPINWCPSCKIGLANEEVVDGKCERCGAVAEKRQKEQWMLRITAYAEKLINDLDTVDYLEKIKTQQINWIGRSEGAEIIFQISKIKSQKNIDKNESHPERIVKDPEDNASEHRDPSLPQDDREDGKDTLKVFTTRPDTLFGCTYMVVSPEHEIISNFKNQILNIKEVEKYIEESKKKSEIERTDATKEKTGVKIEGLVAINPVNNKEIPIYVADYVLSGYGTGAIMAVPGHDKRDKDFAENHDLPVIYVVFVGRTEIGREYDNINKAVGNFPKDSKEEVDDLYMQDGIAINSDFLNGLPTKEAKEKMIQWLEEKGIGQKKVQYKLRDWVFSRQHYWGEPIPVVHCAKCGVVPVSEKDLPVELPNVENYEPTDTGESPLAAMTDWVNVKCPQCGSEAKRETDTMPNWAGSSWYFLRYIDPKNENVLADRKKMDYWMPVDLYNGGMEHTTLHLLYSRFWNKFLYEIGVVPTSEPYARRISHGMILAEDGRKMSKSFGNVVNPNEIVEKYGADTLRVYEMFMGPYDEAIPWNEDGVKGAKRFLDKVEMINDKNKIGEATDRGVMQNPIKEKREYFIDKIEKLLHKTIKKVKEDIELFRFNTAISAMMIFVNEMNNYHKIDKKIFEKFLIILSPFAPHLAEELWEKLGHSESIFKEKWPQYDEALAKEDKINLVVQVNGKLRDTIEVDADSLDESKAKELALASEKVQKWLEGKEPKKVIFVKNKLVSIVI